ncbi:hypothetical protein [Bradyrhizobium sp. Tv2a-2]|uniref:DUF6925 family protein n=1 Tax=Bradyrhizobium sp. Tv2a-2 TaxID=113395 RepID=UPI000428D532|nr:hypothetical protein [Bradyrhizobium sp. Tv2a-2]
MATADDPIAFLADQLAEVEAGFSLGTFGAIAEFMRDAGEPVSFVQGDGAIGAATARGGLRVLRHPDMRLIASESPTTESWSHRVALCLPHLVCAMNGRTELTETGIDHEALREEDRNGVLFDLGLGTLQVDVCIRSADPEVVSLLRSYAGKSIFTPGNDAMRIILATNPHRVFLSRVGRAEVSQPIPPPGGQSPSGPHTHLLPKLLVHGRTHAATEPVPDGWIPCAHVYPPHPLRDQLGRKRPFRLDYHDAFQAVLEGYGEADRVALKRRVVEAVVAGHGPSTLTLPDDRFARATVRVALRQLQALQRPSPSLAQWLADHDRAASTEDEDPMEALH